MTIERDATDQSLEVLYVGTEWIDAIGTSLEATLPQAVIHAVSDPATARSDYTASAFDCIISEYTLPDETGTAFLSSYAVDSELPSLLLANKDTQPTAAEVMAANVTDYFVVDHLDDEFDTLAASIEDAVTRRYRSHHERHEIALELADAGAWEYRTTTETLWWSKQAWEIHGLGPDRTRSPDEISDLYISDDQPRVTDAFENAVDKGEPFDEIAELDSDEQRWIRIRGKPITSDGEGLRISGSYQDVTPFKQREEQFKFLHSAGTELMQATSRDEAAEITIDAAKNILGYARAALRLVDENGEILRVFATTKDNVAAAGERPDYRVDEDVPAARTYRRGQAEVFTDFDTMQNEYERGVLRSGFYVPVGDHGVFSCGNLDPNAYDQTDVDIVAVLTKLTATALTRIEADRELRRKRDQLEDFTGTVAHDLRNPLNVASGHVELARRNPRNADFEGIQDALGRMETIIDDLLKLARAGKSLDDVTAVSLADVTEEAYQHSRSDGLTVMAAVDMVIDADRERLLHILENLFRNAIDHNDPPVSVTVGTLEATKTGGGESRSGFFVEDDGSGIPTDARSKVFENGYTTLTDGTGFGLSIVRHVADAHGWSVEITEGRAGGARFEFTNVPLTSEKTSQ
ncbi:hybrid sensor histidine kinase/response regulator [Haloarcula laminariae]|uniref:hybrid sensor histidine kinase/response regulator n=1 Tax=Haloarcula laminariae TaxID=2961577 RepID=UPI0024066466|nr:ATP-binding protein [Halomicroarcula sp. FL173]